MLDAAAKARLIKFSCSLHASTDFREKLYKVFQNAAKLWSKRVGSGPSAAHVASTLSQSRGIFKVLKWVKNMESYEDAEGEPDLGLRRIMKFEAWLNTLVSFMQDVISIDKLFKMKAVSAKFVWWMNVRRRCPCGLERSLAHHELLLLRQGCRSLPTSLPSCLVSRCTVFGPAALWPFGWPRSQCHSAPANVGRRHAEGATKATTSPARTGRASGRLHRATRSDKRLPWHPAQALVGTLAHRSHTSKRTERDMRDLRGCDKKVARAYGAAEEEGSERGRQDQMMN